MFYRHFENSLVKIWLSIGIFGRIKIGLVFGFCGYHLIGIGLVLVCHFPENDISNRYPFLEVIEMNAKECKIIIYCF